MLHQLSLLASAPADLGYNGTGRLLSPAGSPVKRPSRPRAGVDRLYPAAATGRCAARAQTPMRSDSCAAACSVGGSAMQAFAP